MNTLSSHYRTTFRTLALSSAVIRNPIPFVLTHFTHLFILAVLLLPITLAKAEGLPYRVVRQLERGMSEGEKSGGLVGKLWMERCDPQDKRSIEVVISTQSGDLPLPLDADGSFKLPDLPEKDAETAFIKHNLGAGNLALAFRLGLSQKLLDEAGTGKGQVDIFRATTDAPQKMSVPRGMMEAIIQLSPDMAKTLDEISIIGIKIPGSAKSGVVAKLYKGDDLIREIDTSQPGSTVLLFKDYNPREHRLIVESGFLNAEWLVSGQGKKDPNAIKLPVEVNK